MQTGAGTGKTLLQIPTPRNTYTDVIPASVVVPGVSELSVTSLPACGTRV